MKYIPQFFFWATSFCFSQEISEKVVPLKDLKAVLATILETEQTPIQQRDAARRKYSIDSEQFQK